MNLLFFRVEIIRLPNDSSSTVRRQTLSSTQLSSADMTFLTKLTSNNNNNNANECNPLWVLRLTLEFSCAKTIQSAIIQRFALYCDSPEDDWRFVNEIFLIFTSPTQKPFRSQYACQIIKHDFSLFRSRTFQLQHHCFTAVGQSFLSFACIRTN